MNVATPKPRAAEEAIPPKVRGACPFQQELPWRRERNENATLHDGAQLVRPPPMVTCSIRESALLGSLFAACVAACSAPTTDDPVAEESEDLTSSYVFHCRSSHGTT